MSIIGLEQFEEINNKLKKAVLVSKAIIIRLSFLVYEDDLNQVIVFLSI